LAKIPLNIAFDSENNLIAYSLADGSINIFDIVNQKAVNTIFGTPG